MYQKPGPFRYFRTPFLLLSRITVDNGTGVQFVIG